MIVEALISQLQASNYVMKANVGDVTHEESLVQPSPGGNCLNWVLGHLVATRSKFLREFGGKAPWGEAESKQFDRHAPPISNPADAKPLHEIWSALDETLHSMTEVLSGVTPVQLAQKAPFSPTNNPNETLGSLLATFAFHDAYHAGQTGLLRRLIGKKPVDL